MAQFRSIIVERPQHGEAGDRDGQRRIGDAKANAQLAKNYDKYLANMADSLRGAKSDREADQLIKQANQTKAYIVFLNKQSSQRQ